MIKQYIYTEKFIFAEKTRITADVSASATSLSVKDTGGMSVDNFIMVGNLGTEQTEVRQLNAITDNTTLACDALQFAHTEREPVQVMLYNQIQLYSSSTASGTYSAVGGKVDIDVNRSTGGTLVEDTGTDGFYKITYYNSETLAETDIDNSAVLRPENTEQEVLDNLTYCTLQQIRDISGFKQTLDDFTIDQARRQAQSTVNGYISSVYTLPLSEVPGILSRFTAQLAAAYLLESFITVRGAGGDTKGPALKKQAMDFLNKINEKKIILVSDSGSELSGTDTKTFSFYPNDSSPDGEDYKFTSDSTKQPF